MRTTGKSNGVCGGSLQLAIGRVMTEARESHCASVGQGFESYWQLNFSFFILSDQTTPDIQSDPLKKGLLFELQG